MVSGYKIADTEVHKFWLILSKDHFVCSDNISIALSILSKNGVEEDSISFFSNPKIDFSELEDLANTVSFFGNRAIVIQDFAIGDLNDQDLEKLCDIISNSIDTHFIISLTYEDEKILQSKKYDVIKNLAKENGICHIVSDIDEKYLVTAITAHAKKLGTVFLKDAAEQAVANIGKDVGLLINETEKYASACNYTTITKETVNSIGVKTLEASVFDMVDLICNKKAIKALETLNNLFNMGTEELAVLGALSTSFVDIHRCKIGQKAGLTYQKVHGDFEKSSHPFRYQKAMANSSKFSEKALKDIMQLLLNTDIQLKSTSIDKKQLLSCTITQIIAKGMER